jgi:hypothetical protein
MEKRSFHFRSFPFGIRSSTLGNGTFRALERNLKNTRHAELISLGSHKTEISRDVEHNLFLHAPKHAARMLQQEGIFAYC